MQQRLWAGGCADSPGQTRSSRIARRLRVPCRNCSYQGQIGDEHRAPIHLSAVDDRGRLAAQELLRVFGRAFNDSETYQHAIPSEEYLTNLLGKEHFIVVVAMMEKTVVGGLAAYVLEKFEQQRREIYIYDLAVSDAHRRRGVASETINALKKIAAAQGAYVIFVHADLEDGPAIALYRSLGTMKAAHHFDIEVGT